MQTSSYYRQGTLTVRFCGELDHFAAAAALEAVESAAEEYMPRTCILDFSEMSFMDSSGIAVLLRSERMLQHSGCGIRISGCNAQVRRVLELSGMQDWIADDRHIRKECELL